LTTAVEESTVDGPGGRDYDRIAVERTTAVGVGTAVHLLLEWSANNGWREPSSELVRRFALAAGLDLDSDGSADEMATLVSAWLASGVFREQVRPARRSRAEVPLLLEIAGTVLRGSIDLLVERDGLPPLIVDYKTDRLDGAEPAEWAKRYEVQRDIYSLAVANALGTSEVDVAYVFLKRPNEPVEDTLDATALDMARKRIRNLIPR
jgi:ATP-dependent helicase/nuclease subunit A